MRDQVEAQIQTIDPIAKQMHVSFWEEDNGIFKLKINLKQHSHLLSAIARGNFKEKDFILLKYISVSGRVVHFDMAPHPDPDAICLKFQNEQDLEL
jgi:hypothetical protein